VSWHLEVASSAATIIFVATTLQVRMHQCSGMFINLAVLPLHQRRTCAVAKCQRVHTRLGPPLLCTVASCQNSRSALPSHYSMLGDCSQGTVTLCIQPRSKQAMLLSNDDLWPDPCNITETVFCLVASFLAQMCCYPCTLQHCSTV
jgi:hypothetical protein